MRKLSELIEEHIPAEMGIRSGFLKKIGLLGIEVDSNEADYKCGFCAQSFILPSKGIVIKFFGTDKAENPDAPDPDKIESNYVLQPYCSTTVLGNPLLVYPLLKVDGVNDNDLEVVRNGLVAGGKYDFIDDKLENIGVTDGDVSGLGVTADGVPYLLDADAISVKRNPTQNRADQEGRVRQWEVINPGFTSDNMINLSHAKEEWSFDEMVENYLKPNELSSSSPHFAMRVEGAKPVIPVGGRHLVHNR